MKQIKKILIVGGGPAGLMTALSLASQPVEVTVIDKSKWPIDKVCGEGIMPKGFEILKKYGVDRRLSSKLSRAFTGITYFDSQIAKGHFQSGLGYVVRRTELSQALYETVQEKSNINLLANTELHSYTEDSSSVTVQVRNCRDQEEYELDKFDLIVACDGLRSKVRKLAKLEATPLRKQNRIGARVHYQIPPWTQQVEVHWGRGIECYIAPVSETCVEFVFGWDQDLLQVKTGRSDQLEAKLFSYFPELANKIVGKSKLSELAALGTFARSAKTPLQRRIVLIGDASVFLDPITGEGLSLAFEQAEILARYLPDIHTKHGAAQFISKINSLKNHYLRITKLALYLSEHPKLRQVLIYFLARFPRLFEHLLEVNMGSRSLFAFLTYPSREIIVKSFDEVELTKSI